MGPGRGGGRIGERKLDKVCYHFRLRAPDTREVDSAETLPPTALVCFACESQKEREGVRWKRLNCFYVQNG